MTIFMNNISAFNIFIVAVLSLIRAGNHRPTLMNGVSCTVELYTAGSVIPKTIKWYQEMAQPFSRTSLFLTVPKKVRLVHSKNKNELVRVKMVFQP